MSEERVNQLLADLDRALSVESTPALTAKVRARIECEPAANWFTQHWHVAAAGVAALVVGAYLVMPRLSEVHPPKSAAVSRATAQPLIQSEPPASPLTPAPTGQTLSGRHVQAVPVRSTAVAQREPEVLVSPSHKVALAQLFVAVREGRVDVESLQAEPALPGPLVIAPLVLEPFKIDMVPLNRGSEGEIIR